MRSLVAAIVILSGCAASPSEPLAVPPVPPAAAKTTPPAKAVPPTPAAAATASYHRTEAAIGPVVTAPATSADNIRAIDLADRLARRALNTLVSQDGNPTPAAIADARKSLDELIAALEASKGPSP